MIFLVIRQYNSNFSIDKAIEHLDADWLSLY